MTWPLGLLGVLRITAAVRSRESADQRVDVDALGDVVGAHRLEDEAAGLAVRPKLREVRRDPDHLVPGIEKGPQRQADGTRGAPGHGDARGSDPGRGDVLRGPLAQLGVTEVGHVRVTSGERFGAGTREGIAHQRGRVERLTERQVDHAIVAVLVAKPLALGEHPPDPAAGLDL